MKRNIATKASSQKKELKLASIAGVPVTNTSKTYFPKLKITKGDVIEYYDEVSSFILPYLKDRPESLKRNPNGIADKGFFQKDAPENVPPWIKTERFHSESAHKDIDYILCNDEKTLIYLANLGCIEFNPWHSTIQKPDYPDYLILDIDPSPKNSFDRVIETAIVIKGILDKAKVKSYCKTSGASGMHIYVPLQKKYD
jgi:bifunctional non-homologous end joining protein LigD